VAGIGKQRQRMGADACGELEDDESRSRDQRPDQNPAGRRAMVVRMQTVLLSYSKVDGNE
jgi:hypothetical protein